MIRFATKEDLLRVNELRSQVNEVHVNGRPDIFKPGFNRELQDYIYDVFEDESKKILLAVREKVNTDGNTNSKKVEEVICGFAIMHHFLKPESPYMKERKYLDVDEFGVDEKYRCQGVAREMMQYIKVYAREQGYENLELNMWEFNQGALEFYEEMGFKTYRRYMQLDLK